MRDTEIEAETQAEGEREKQAPCREPDVGLDPRFPGSHPGAKVAPNCWATGAACFSLIYSNDLMKQLIY